MISERENTEKGNSPSWACTIAHPVGGDIFQSSGSCPLAPSGVPIIGKRLDREELHRSFSVPSVARTNTELVLLGCKHHVPGEVEGAPGLWPAPYRTLLRLVTA